MGDIKTNLDKMKFDTRLIDLNLKNGKLTEEDVKSHLSKLPDEASKTQSIDLEASASDDYDADIH